MHDLDVAALGVVLVGDLAVPGARAFGEDVEIMPVQMHGVGSGKFVMDDDADGGVVAEVVDVPLGVVGVGEVAAVGKHEDGVVVVGAVGDAVHVEEVVVGGVGAEGDGDVLRRGGFVGGGEGEVGDCFVEVVVAAFGVFV